MYVLLTEKEFIFKFSKCPFFFPHVLYNFSCMAEFKSSVLPSVFQNTVVC